MNKKYRKSGRSGKKLNVKRDTETVYGETDSEKENESGVCIGKRKKSFGSN